MIEIILPPSVAAVDTTADPPDARLFPEEAALIRQAVDKRRREFTTGRACAREAMGLLGRTAEPVLRGERGEPLWPMGLVGSITHCAGYRAAALSRAAEVAAIGIDAEPNEPLPNGVLPAVSSPAEREMIHELRRGHPGVRWDRLLFCAKESVYKVWFPLTGRWLGFEDAEVSVSPLAGTFEARLLRGGPRVDGHELTGLTGRWLVKNGLLLTAIVVPAHVR
ncbi:4'-phosphopantetheinyl transferase superfamily protein [Spongiactinospora sp. TRM90649]|uniref:4'-phosphopantetheinyl transferase family protein n=1 Tax=Spongiactinospora sp. TRM90649 TaxID=3031114 RepID=UPI0023F7D41F|nr:4'-phosphopantetheinyl transferase superfamily protein [Spongiactinospora sp. TRM90649]MDF5757181.1 4'-phosphopantetheinyl transferase superfamily protein [Spongiactinospora sp. TRM90649]